MTRASLVLAWVVLLAVPSLASAQQTVMVVGAVVCNTASKPGKGDVKVSFWGENFPEVRRVGKTDPDGSLRSTFPRYGPDGKKVERLKVETQVINPETKNPYGATAQYDRAAGTLAFDAIELVGCEFESGADGTLLVNLPDKKEKTRTPTGPLTTAMAAAGATAGTVADGDGVRCSVPSCKDDPPGSQPPGGSTTTGNAVGPGQTALTAGTMPAEPVVAGVVLPAAVIDANGGDLLASLRTTRFRSPGFRYSPVGDTSSAVFTNPSASALDLGGQAGATTGGPYDFLVTNVRYALVNGIAFGGGYAVQSQAEYRRFRTAAPPPSTSYIADRSRYVLHADDQLLTGFVAKRFGPVLSLSAGITRQWHTGCDCRTTATRLTYESGLVTDTLSYDPSEARHAEWGLSLGATWIARPGLQLGVATTNLAGRNPVRSMYRRDRSVGAGIAWSLRKIGVDLGADVEAADITGVTSSVGVSARVPKVPVDLRAGYVSGVDAPSWGVRVWIFDVTGVRERGEWTAFVGVRLK